MHRPPTPSILHKLLPLAALLATAAGDPATPQSRLDSPQWAAHFSQAQAALNRGPYDIVLFGDSITGELDRPGPQSWSNIQVIWQRWFACRRALQLGFVGDTTANLLWRIENGELPTTPPKAAIVLIGTNNNRPQLDWPAQQTAQAIITIVRELHHRLPPTHILVLGVPPNAHGPAVNAKIDQINATLAATDWAPLNASYLPTTALFEQNGQLDTTLFREPHMNRPALHPDAQGWEKLASHIIPAIAPYTQTQAAPCPGAPPAP